MVIEYIHGMKKYLPFVSLFVALFVLMLLGDGSGSYVDIAGAAVVLTITAGVILYRKPARHFPKQLIISWSALLVYLLIIIPFSADIGYSIRASMRYVEAFLIYWVFYVFTYPGEEKIFARTLSIFGCVALVVTVFFNLVPAVRLFLPFMNLFWSYDGHNHMSDLLLFILLPVLATVRHPSWLRYVVIAAFFTLFVLFQARAALIVAAAAFFIWTTRKRPIPTTRGIFYAVCVCILSVGAVILIPKLPAGLNGQALSRPTKASLSSRLEYWHQAALAIRERPVFGFGTGTFSLLSPKFQSAPNRTSWFAHSYALETAAESGVIGLALLLWVLYVSCIKPIFSVWTERPPRIERAVTAGSIALLLVYGLVDFSLSFFVVWMLFWAACGMVSYNEK